MSQLEGVALEELKDQLDQVQSREASRRLMVAIAHKQGVSKKELVEWYDISLEDLEEWFEEFESESVEEVIQELERFELPGRSVKPEVRQPGLAHVRFLNYDVIHDFGWDIDDQDLFEKASNADLDHTDYGRVAVERGESILEAAERRGYEWPYACRGGACSNCAVILVEGEIAMPGNQILPEGVVQRGARLTCVGVPASEEVKLIYNAKHVDYLDELRLPPRQFEQSRSA